METIGSSEWLIYMHRGKVKVKEGRRDGLVFRPKGSRTCLTTCPPFPNVLFKGAMRVEKEEDIQRAKTLVWENYAFNHFDPRKINNKCKECKYLKVTWHNEGYTRGSGECTECHRRNWYNVSGRVFSNQACRYFEKKEEENMTQKEFDKTIEAMDKKISDMAKLMDKMDELIENLPSDLKDIKKEEKPVEEKKERLTNKYNIGDVVYVPFRIKGIDIAHVEDPYHKGEVIMYKLSRPFNIDSITQDELVENGSHYWKCHATDRVTQGTLEMAQMELK